MRRNPDGVLPVCLLGHPPDLRTSYSTPIQMQLAWQRHLELLDFFDQLNNGEKTANLWQKLRGLCLDDLEYQFRASSLVRVALAAVAGTEEQWNGPSARKLFDDVKDAAVALRRAFDAASRELPAPPTGDGMGPDIARGPMPPTSLEELEAAVKTRDARDLHTADEDDERDDTSLTDGVSKRIHDDLLDNDSARMREAWRGFWNYETSLVYTCAMLEKAAVDVEAAWKATPKYNVFKDPAKRKVGYLMSRVGLHLNNRFPAQDVGALASVCDAIVELAYPGEDRLDASLKYIGRERAKGQNPKK